MEPWHSTVLTPLGGRQRLLLRGDLDDSSAKGLPELLSSTGRVTEPLVLDVAGVGRVAVGGLRAIAREERRRAVRGSSLTLVGASPALLRLLAGAGMLWLAQQEDVGDRVSA